MCWNMEGKNTTNLLLHWNIMTLKNIVLTSLIPQPSENGKYKSYKSNGILKGYNYKIQAPWMYH